MLGLLKLNLNLNLNLNLILWSSKMVKWIKVKLKAFIKNKSQNFKLLNQWLGLL